MYNKLLKALSNIKNEYDKGLFKPILEDDFLGRVYYHLLNDNYDIFCDKLFIKTRILSNIKLLNKNFKYDLVFGEKIVEKQNVVYVNPKLVAEFKIYPIGFKDQQLSRRRNHVIDDIKKINKINKYYKNPVELIICLFDEIKWLKGFNQNESNCRLDKFIRNRDLLNKRIKIIGIEVENNLKCKIFQF